MHDVPPDLDDDPIRALGNSILHLSKREAAERHIEAAVKFWHSGDFDLAITLAGAADGMTKGEREETMYARLIALRPSHLSKETARNNLNASRNWLKHDATYLPASRPFTYFESGFHIMLAADKWGMDQHPAVKAMTELWDFLFQSMMVNGDAERLAHRLASLESSTS